MRRRHFLQTCAASLAACAVTSTLHAQTAPRKPNIIYILCDDLGYGELGCYGQKKIKTPNIDKIAAEGMCFDAFYSGHAVCAPSRCTLMTGLHTGHAQIRQNKVRGKWASNHGQHPIAKDTQTIATLVKGQGYATACIGKWGLGQHDTTGDPLKQGFDSFFGYNCQRHAHNYYPKTIQRNGEQIPLPGNEGKATGKIYTPDLMIKEAHTFIDANKDKPFFLYFATPVPHAAIQVPEDSLAEYADAFDDTHYRGKAGYQPHSKPRAAYAAMITRLDRDVGTIMAKLKALGIDDNTVVFFSSDNGTASNGGVQAKYFNSVSGLRGLKCSFFEGGIRVPMIARWPGKIKPNTRSSLVGANWDMLPTIGDIVGYKAKDPIDGISILPTLIGKGTQQIHKYLYWEDRGGQQAVRTGDWKGIRQGLRANPEAPIMLFNLKTDRAETKNVAKKHPEIVKRISTYMIEGHTPSKTFPFKLKRPKNAL